MLPEVKKKQFTNEFEYCSYTDKLITAFIDMNKDSHESIGKLNAALIGSINELLCDYLKPLTAQLSLICALCRNNKSDSSGTMFAFRLIKSVGGQKRYMLSLKNTLKRARVDEYFYKIINKKLRQTKERMIRLNEVSMPTLLESTDLYIYKIYCERNNLNFSEEMSKYDCDKFDDELSARNVEEITNIVSNFLSSLPSEEAEGIRNIRRTHEHRRELIYNKIESDKRVEKEKKDSKLRDDLNDVLSLVSNKYVNTLREEDNIALRRLYTRAIEQYRGRNLNIDVKVYIIVATTIRTRKVTSNTIRFLREGGTEFNHAVRTSEIFILPTDTDKLKSKLKEFENTDFIVQALEVASINRGTDLCELSNQKSEAEELFNYVRFNMPKCRTSLLDCCYKLSILDLFCSDINIRQELINLNSNVLSYLNYILKFSNSLDLCDISFLQQCKINIDKAISSIDLFNERIDFLRKALGVNKRTISKALRQICVQYYPSDGFVNLPKNIIYFVVNDTKNGVELFNKANLFKNGFCSK